MTNKENRFLAHVGQVLTNDSDPKKIKEYQIEEFLGKGAYASVFLVKSLKNGKHYAAKILKNDPEAINHCAKHEKKILLELNKAEKNIQKQVIAEDFGIKSSQSSRIVILKDYFIIHQEKPVPVAHFVLIFEKLDISLYSFLESTEFHGLTLCMIQRFAYFALEGLQLMKSRRITHSDIKPENIMLVE
jgi:serine/threonine protein kinase